jgi:hypothetical protein
MVAPTRYSSNDASAPQLTGEVGKLNQLLTACLCVGYGSKASAGWTKVYSQGDSYAAFRPPAGLRHFLNVDDTNPQLSRVVGFTAMSTYVNQLDYTGGTNGFPSQAQFPAGLYLRKSITASNVTRPWLLFATDQTFYLFVFGGSTTYATFGGGDSHLGFGQLTNPMLPNDLYHSFILAGTDTSTSSTTATNTRQVFTALSTSALGGHYHPFTYTQNGAPSNFAKRSNNVYAQTTSGVGGPAYPNSVTGGLPLSRITSQEPTLLNRGLLPGLWNLGVAASITSFGQYDIFAGTGTLLGRTFMIVNTASGGLAVELTDGSW